MTTSQLVCLNHLLSHRTHGLLTSLTGVQEAQSVDESNIIEERTRGAAKADYRDPEDGEGLPTQDGTSSTS